jgi:hypothetical protein
VIYQNPSRRRAVKFFKLSGSGQLVGQEIQAGGALSAAEPGITTWTLSGVETINLWSHPKQPIETISNPKQLHHK